MTQKQRQILEDWHEDLCKRIWAEADPPEAVYETLTFLEAVLTAEEPCN